MNQIERQMLDLLVRGRETFGVLGVKAEFEAEGARFDELLRLLDLARKADLKIGLKIGGCEALRDLIESKPLGEDYLIAPMNESVYALSKFIDAKNKLYTPDERRDVAFLFNLETKTAFADLEGLMAGACAPEGLDGVVFGRSDFSGSLGLAAEAVNDDAVTRSALAVARACKARGLDFAVGGGISIEALPALRDIAAVHLTRFETRKVIFAGEALRAKEIKSALTNALQFEVLWLSNERDYYGALREETSARLAILERRWRTVDER